MSAAVAALSWRSSTDSLRRFKIKCDVVIVEAHQMNLSIKVSDFRPSTFAEQSSTNSMPKKMSDSWNYKMSQKVLFQSCRERDQQAPKSPRLHLTSGELKKSEPRQCGKQFAKHVLKWTKKYTIPSRYNAFDSWPLFSRGRSNAFHHTVVKTNTSNASYMEMTWVVPPSRYENYAHSWYPQIGYTDVTLLRENTSMGICIIDHEFYM
jgi:hypothetical protein